MTKKSFLTDDEAIMLESSIRLGEIDRSLPCVISSVSRTQLSIARHYGVVTLNGHSYTYFPAGDELIRDDVLKWVTKLRKDADKHMRAEAKAKQGRLL